MNAEAANASRYEGRPGHVESWFVRANDPAAPRAVWLKMTILAPLDGPAVAETWFIWFDATAPGLRRALAHKATVPVGEGSFEGGVEQVAGCRFELSAHGSLRGALDTHQGKVEYALRLQSSTGPMELFPLRAMYSPLVPGVKTLTPHPVLRLDGELRLPGETVKVDGWRGSQGHNWGREHTFEQIWGQCVFPASADGPAVMVEGYSARARSALGVLPRLSALVVRRGDDELRFDRTFDFFRQQAFVGERRWTVRLRGPAGEARLRMDATGRPAVCLGYQNPDRSMSYCVNSKLADVLLEVKPRRGPAWRCQSPHGGALEMVTREREPGMEVV